MMGPTTGLNSSAPFLERASPLGRATTPSRGHDRWGRIFYSPYPGRSKLEASSLLQACGLRLVEAARHAKRSDLLRRPEGLTGSEQLNGNLRRKSLDPMGHFQHSLLFRNGVAEHDPAF